MSSAATGAISKNEAQENALVKAELPPLVLPEGRRTSKGRKYTGTSPQRMRPTTQEMER